MRKIELHPSRQRDNELVLSNQFPIDRPFPMMIMGNFGWIVSNLIKGDSLFRSRKTRNGVERNNLLVALELLGLEGKYPVQICPHSDLIIRAGEIMGIPITGFYLANVKNPNSHFCGIWVPFHSVGIFHNTHEHAPTPSEPAAACMCRIMLAVLMQIYRKYTTPTPKHICFGPDDEMPFVNIKSLRWQSAHDNPNLLRALADQLETVRENQRVMLILQRQAKTDGSSHTKCETTEYLEKLIREIASFIPNLDSISISRKKLPKEFRPENYKVCNQLPQLETLVRKS